MTAPAHADPASVSSRKGRPTAARIKHVPELDAIRGVAALSVVLFHAFPYALFFGWSFVDCFFVLSGYLITTILLANVDSPRLLSAFYFRRALRIWPVYYGTLALVLIANMLARTGFPTTRAGLAQHLFFVQNVQDMWGGTPPDFVAPFSPSWSVAIEEQFYLAWPLLITFFGRRCVVPVACMLLVATTIYQCVGAPMFTLLSRGDGLAAGCLLAALVEHPDHDRVVKILRALLLGGIAVALCAAVFWHDPRLPTAPWRALLFKAFACIFAGAVGLTVRFSGHPWLAPLRWRGAALLGLISYSLYMLHLPLFNWMPVILARAGVSSPSLREALVWISIFAAPACSYVLVERPILTLKRLVDYA